MSSWTGRYTCSQQKRKLYHPHGAKRWFLHGMFKVVSRPFYQLMSVHAFSKKDACLKQLPLLFVLMSRRQNRDYLAGFQDLLRRLDPEVPSIEWIMLDFIGAFRERETLSVQGETTWSTGWLRTWGTHGWTAEPGDPRTGRCSERVFVRTTISNDVIAASTGRANRSD